MKIMKRVKVTKWELLDREQRESGEELQELLKEKYNRVEVSYINVGYETFDRGLSVDIYTNDYNYKQISLKYPCSDATIRDYFHTVLNCFYKNDCKIHLATAEEIYLHNIIKENELEDFYISDGILYAEGQEISDLKNVVSISKDKDRIVINEDNCRCIIDLESETYYCEDIDEEIPDYFKGCRIKKTITIEDIAKCKKDFENIILEYRAKFDKLTGCLEHLNSKSRLYKWKLDNGVLCETDRKSGLTCTWAKVKDIKEFYFDEDNLNILTIEVKNDESIILDAVNGGMM